VLFIFLVAVLYCFACSTIYHNFADHVNSSLWLRIDHTGTSRHLISLPHFSFTTCNNEGQLFTVHHDDLNDRKARITIYVALRVLTTFPGLHIGWTNGLDQLPSSLLTHFGLLVILNIIGGGMYVVSSCTKQ
jgi:adiponectin receptor